MSPKIEFNRWTVRAVEDEDGHLGVWVIAKDGSTPIPLEADIAASHSEWGERFASARIEEYYRAGR